MTSIRKFGHAAILAAVAFTFVPTSSLAQQAALGRFILTHDERWGSAVVRLRRAASSIRDRGAEIR